MLLDEIKARMFRAMKEKREVEKEILRVAIGEITTDAARPGRKGDDAEATAIVRRLQKSVEETLTTVQDETQRATLEQELAVLASLLPKALGLDELVAALAPTAEAIRAAAGDGPATGIAMKHLKGAGVAADGKLVSEAVKRLRSG
ncbi:MAG: GatB/YqeY domain-containing protein [Myxococcota bacterium]|jgi:uncharacterized protein|nr:GatB/YqeY domain-containing protein [Myxococcota bacterium]